MLPHDLSNLIEVRYVSRSWYALHAQELPRDPTDLIKGRLTRLGLDI